VENQVSDQPETASESPTPVEAPTAAVTMTVFEWHRLLWVLEHAMCITNWDPPLARALYTKIASALQGNPVRIVDGR
jgi:hypothetical protein